jgi:hypothetical protein
MEYRLLRAKYSTTDQQWDFHRRVVERVAQLPGIENAALARAVPYSGNGGSLRFTPPAAQPLRLAKANSRRQYSTPSRSTTSTQWLSRF